MLTLGREDRGHLISEIHRPVVKPMHRPWNKERQIGQKRSLLPKQVCVVCTQFELAGDLRDLALFNLALDRK